MLEKVFVYGTLRRGQGNNVLLRKSNFIGSAITESSYRIKWSGPVPFADRGGDTSIAGEVFEVDKNVLNDLDRLEGHPNWYRREKVKVQIEHHTELEVWMYLNNF